MKIKRLVYITGVLILASSLAYPFGDDWGKLKLALQKLEWSILPKTSEAVDLGSSSKKFGELHVVDAYIDHIAGDTGLETLTAGDFITNSGTAKNPILNVDVDDSADTITELWTGGKISDELDLKIDIADSTLFIWKDGSQDFTANQSMGGFKITSAGTAVDDSDVVNKGYVDNAVVGGTANANITLEYKLYRSALSEAYTGYIDCQLVISDRSDFDTPVVDIDTATSQTSWLAYGAASDSNESWSASGMPATDVRSIIYAGATLTRDTVYYYRWRTYKHGDSGTATDYKGGMLCN